MNQGGKGCKPRPFSVSQQEYDNRWDAIFGRDKQQNEEKVDNESSGRNADNRQERIN
jgi:hypothetical protein